MARLVLVAVITAAMRVPAQVAPSAKQPLALTAFGGMDGVYTGLEGGHNLSVTAGADLEFRSRQFFSLQPSFEIRGTYPFHSGQLVGEKNLLGGLRETSAYGRLHPYADILVGRGRLTYVHGAPDAAGNYLYLHSSSLVLSPGAGLELRLTRRFALKADVQLQRYATPVTQSGTIYSWPLFLGVAYRFDRNHPGGRPIP